MVEKEVGVSFAPCVSGSSPWPFSSRVRLCPEWWEKAGLPSVGHPCPTVPSVGDSHAPKSFFDLLPTLLNVELLVGVTLITDKVII